MALCSSLNWAISFVVSLTFIPMLHALGAGLLFALYCILRCVYRVVQAGICSGIGRLCRLTRRDKTLHSIYLVFPFCSLFALVFVEFFVPETSGMSLESISSLFAPCNGGQVEGVPLVAHQAYADTDMVESDEFLFDLHTRPLS